ncbi:MAG TPA: peptide ABC transporter substrate-binding protein [Chloroflexota bacterium]|nr:peptide ABC transporter substrate-binding protein [Chloroflexota bacterium]
MGVSIPVRPGRHATPLAVTLTTAALLLGCAAPAGQRPSEASASSTAVAAPAHPTIVNVGLQADREPASPAFFGASGSGSSPLEVFYAFHASLTAYDPAGAVMPVLAQKVPSLQDGDWRVLPEGGMEVTWKLKPGLVWHDGTPLTADDFILGYQLNTDPELASSIPGALDSVSSVRGIDSQTLVVTWKSITVAAGVSGYDGIPAVPTHIFAEQYAAGDKTALSNSPYWSTQFVGLGPYKLTEWSRGSFIEGQAFDRYVGGRPKIDRIVLKFLGDANALVASVLAGDIDIIPLGAQVDVQPVSVVRDAWAPTSGGTTGAVAKGVRMIYLNFRDATLPWVEDVRVRQAMLHALDRDTIVETLEGGLTQRADFIAPLGDPVLEMAANAGLPLYPFDLNRATELMAQAGWTKGPDGVFHNGLGQPFSAAAATSSEGTNPQEAAIVASQLTTAGFQADPAPYAQTASNRNQLAMSFPSMLIKPWNFSISAPGSLRQSQIGTAQNAYGGNNYGGYVNPTYEELYRAYAGELESGRRQQALFKIVKLLDEQLPVLPIFYVPQVYAFRKGLDGPGSTAYLQAASTWNVATWTIR